MEIVIALRVKWTTKSELIAQDTRRTAWQERMYDTSNLMVDRAVKMMDFPLEVVEFDEEQDEDGRHLHTTIKPGRWTFDTVPKLVSAADKTARLALDMDTDSTRIKQELSGVDGEPIAVEITAVKTAVLGKLQATGNKLRERLKQQMQSEEGQGESCD